MSAVFPSKRGKRSRPSTSSTSNSFVKTVTEKVSGLLPARISKWFSSPKPTDVNGSTSAADVTDSSTDDEDAPITAQAPSAKRMRFSSPGQHSQFNPVETNWLPNNLEVQEPSNITNTSAQSPAIRSMFRHETNFMSTPVRPVNEETFVENNEHNNSSFKVQHSVSSIRQSVAKKRELIFQSSKTDSTKATPNLSQTQEPKQPYFKPSLLSSPFYSGRTMYGGASSFYMNQSNIKQKKVALVNESKANNTTTISHSTKTIMDLLENYSSPLSDARRIPQYVKKPNSDATNTSTQFSSQGNRSEGNKDAYKMQELYVPNIASIIQIKQRSRLMDTTSIARQLIASHSSTIGFNPYPKLSNKQNQDEQEEDTLSSLKQYRLKTKCTRKTRKDSENGEDSSPVNLPKAVLQIEPNNLPNFTATLVLPTTSMAIATTTSSTTLKSFTTSTPVVVAEPRPTYKFGYSNNHSSKNMFTFSEPDPVACDLSMTATKSFSCKFYSPETEKDNIPAPLHTNVDQENINIKLNAKKDLILTNMLNERKHLDSSINNKSDVDKSLSCETKQPATILDRCIKCVVCNLTEAQKHNNKCINCEKDKMKTSDATQLKPKEVATWKCNDCWVNNNMTVDKCVCCGAVKPNNSIPLTEKTPINATVTDWQCISCSTCNKDSLEKFIACGGAKVTSKVNNTVETSSISTANDINKTIVPTPTKAADNVFTNIVNTQKNDKWECPCCLVQNEKDKSACICCGMEKENEKATDNKIRFNFNTVSTKFKFGIFNEESQETDMDNIMEEESLPEVPKAIETTDNSSLSQMTTISNNNFGDKSEFAKEYDQDSNNINFGLPESTAIPSLNNMHVPQQPTNINMDKEKPEDLPVIDFEKEENNKRKPFFEYYTPKSEDTDSTKSVSFMGSSASSQDKKISQDYPALPAYPSSAIAAAVITTSPQAPSTQNTFRFSSSKLNLSGNPFGSSASTTPVTTMSFVMPSQSVPTITATVSIGDLKSGTKLPTTVSFFGKRDDVATTTPSLFQKSESAVKTAPTAVTVTPIFNFGCNTQNINPSAPVEKPKFNFVFGNNNATESSTIFKPGTFGAIPESDTGSNKFTLPTGNTLGTGTGLFGTPLSGNGLSGGSTMTAATPATTTADVPVNTNSGGSGLQASTTLTGVFGSSGQTENMWSTNNNASNNSFTPNTTGSALQKPSPFGFGTSTPFNAHSATPTFGSNTPKTANMFGMANQATGTQPAMFSNPPQIQTAPNIFGNPTPTTNSAPALGNMFGTQNIGATAAFGSANPTIPSFEAPALNPAPTPAFNFGAPQSTNIMGFGQPSQQAGVFGFVGGSPAGAPQVQFSMGTAPKTNTRPIRKAARRNPQR